MMVWRIQHDCTHPHGPLAPCPEYGWLANAPSYGACLEAPQSADSGLAHIKLRGEYIFGTLPEQFPRWWSSSVPNSLSDKWVAVLFDVDDRHAFVGKNQVIFDSYFATEVLKTTTDFPR